MKSPIPQHPIFIKAIENRVRLSCRYHGKRRVIEPQCYGIGHRGRELVRVHQIQRGRDDEPLFFASDIEEIAPIGSFAKPGPHYTRNDSAMATIFAQL